MEAEDFARAGFGIVSLGEAGNDAGAFVEEGQRRAVVEPSELGRGVAFGLPASVSLWPSASFLASVMPTAF